MALFSLISIIFFVILIALFWRGVRFSHQQTFFSKQKIKWIFAIYVGIFVISTIIYMILPKNFYAYELDGKLHESSPAPIETEIVNTEINFYDAVANGTYDELEGVYQNGEWEFDFTNDELTIRSFDDYYGIQIFVEHKEANDDKIEAAFYSTKSIIGGFDYTDKIKPPFINLSYGILQITPPRQIELKFQRFDKEGVVGQFTGGNWFSSSHSITTHLGVNMLYVKVPKDLTIIEDGVFIEYVKNIRQ